MNEYLMKGILFLLIAIASTFLVQYLWNDLFPVLFGLKTITFWQAFKLDVLITILWYQPRSSE